MTRTFKILLLVIGAIIILADQTIKYFILEKIPSQGFFLVKSGWFNLKIQATANPHLAFSFPLPQILIFFLLLTIITALLLTLRKELKKNNKTFCLLLTLIIAGALANSFDRLLLGQVTDYISLNLNTFFWPIFNLADIFIVGGAITLIIKNLKNKI